MSTSASFGKYCMLCHAGEKLPKLRVISAQTYVGMSAVGSVSKVAHLSEEGVEAWLIHTPKSGCYQKRHDVMAGNEASLKP